MTTSLVVTPTHLQQVKNKQHPPEITAENPTTNHESHPCNDLFAKVFYLTGFIENRGRGYEKWFKNNSGTLRHDPATGYIYVLQ